MSQAGLSGTRLATLAAIPVDETASLPTAAGGDEHFPRLSPDDGVSWAEVLSFFCRHHKEVLGSEVSPRIREPVVERWRERGCGCNTLCTDPDVETRVRNVTEDLFALCEAEEKFDSPFTTGLFASDCLSECSRTRSMHPDSVLRSSMDSEIKVRAMPRNLFNIESRTASSI